MISKPHEYLQVCKKNEGSDSISFCTIVLIGGFCGHGGATNEVKSIWKNCQFTLKWGVLNVKQNKPRQPHCPMCRDQAVGVRWGYSGHRAEGSAGTFGWPPAAWRWPPQRRGFVGWRQSAAPAEPPCHWYLDSVAGGRDCARALHTTYHLPRQQCESNSELCARLGNEQVSFNQNTVSIYLSESCGKIQELPTIIVKYSVQHFFCLFIVMWNIRLRVLKSKGVTQEKVKRKSKGKLW